MKFTPVIELKFVRIDILVKSIFNYDDDDKQEKISKIEIVNFVRFRFE